MRAARIAQYLLAIALVVGGGSIQQVRADGASAEILTVTSLIKAEARLTICFSL